MMEALASGEGFEPAVETQGWAGVRPFLDRVYIVVLYFFATGAIARIFTGEGQQQNGPQSSAVSQGINGAIYVLTLGLSFRYLPQMWRLFSRSTWMFVLFAYFYASLAWSSDYPEGLRYLRYLLVLLFAANYLALRHTAEFFVRTLVWCSLAMGVMSVAGEYLLPPSDNLAPGWTGIFVTKNFLGSAMATGISAVLALRGRWTILKVVTVALSSVLLILSQSFTSVLCVLVTVGVVVYVNVSKRSKLLLLGGLALGSLTLLVKPDIIAAGLGVGGKSTDLTGRDKIWDFAWQGFLKRPFFGYGASGFWMGDGQVSRWILGWNPAQAHNGYLEISLRGGLVCLALLTIVLIASFPLADRVRTRIDSTAGRFLLFVTTTLIIHNSAESDFMAPSGLWMIFLIAYFLCRKQVDPEFAEPLNNYAS